MTFVYPSLIAACICTALASGASPKQSGSEGSSNGAIYAAAYYDVTVLSDGVTLDGYTTLDAYMDGGPEGCEHSYGVSVYFYGPSGVDIGSYDGQTATSEPASNDADLRRESEAVTDGTGTSVYTFAPAATGYCNCSHTTFMTTEASWIAAYIKLPVVYEITTIDQGHGLCTSAPNCLNTPTCCVHSCVVDELDGGPCDPGHKTTWFAYSDFKDGPYSCPYGLSAFDPSYTTKHVCE